MTTDQDSTTPRRHGSLPAIMAELPDHLVTDSEFIRYAATQAQLATTRVEHVLVAVQGYRSDVQTLAQNQERERAIHLQNLDAAKGAFAKVGDDLAAFRKEAAPLLQAQTQFLFLKKVAGWGMAGIASISATWLAFEHAWQFFHK